MLKKDNENSLSKVKFNDSVVNVTDDTRKNKNIVLICEFFSNDNIVYLIKCILISFIYKFFFKKKWQIKILGSYNFFKQIKDFSNFFKLNFKN